MIDNFIQLKKDNVIRLGIKDADGNETGEHLEFDLDDIELPLKYQELVESDKRNRANLRNQLTIIEKRQDIGGKKLFTKNQEDEMKVINDFYKKEAEALELFLGKDGVKKLLNGRELGWTTLDDIIDIILVQISPYIEQGIQNYKENLKTKFREKSKLKDIDVEVIENVNSQEN